ncbi:MAG: hypothetical protein GY928_25370, partial [Colwellia sp.]|nr:hypothetical protein [Colwellia sp.]
MRYIAHFVKLVVIVCLLTLTINAYSGTKYEYYEVKIVDAQDGKPIQGAEVIIKKGEEEKKGITKSNGYVTFKPFPFTEEDDRDGLISFEVSAQGYYPLEDKCPCFQHPIALSKRIVTPDSFRIVLMWGEKPKDLDSHLWFQDNHVFYSEKKGTLPNMKSELDIDDTDSYGPETVTILNKYSNEIYYYSVHDYTNRKNGSSNELSSISDARVYVYASQEEGPMMKFHVPEGKTGNKWDVFYIDKNGEIVTVNRISQSNYTTGKK